MTFKEIVLGVLAANLCLIAYIEPTANAQSEYSDTSEVVFTEAEERALFEKIWRTDPNSVSLFGPLETYFPDTYETVATAYSIGLTAREILQDEASQQMPFYLAVSDLVLSNMRYIENVPSNTLRELVESEIEILRARTNASELEACTILPFDSNFRKTVRALREGKDASQTHPNPPTSLEIETQFKPLRASVIEERFMESFNEHERVSCKASIAFYETGLTLGPTITSFVGKQILTKRSNAILRFYTGNDIIRFWYKYDALEGLIGLYPDDLDQVALRHISTDDPIFSEIRAAFPDDYREMIALLKILYHANHKTGDEYTAQATEVFYKFLQKHAQYIAHAPPEALREVASMLLAGVEAEIDPTLCKNKHTKHSSSCRELDALWAFWHAAAIGKLMPHSYPGQSLEVISSNMPYIIKDEKTGNVLIPEEYRAQFASDLKTQLKAIEGNESEEADLFRASLFAHFTPIKP